MPSKMPSKKNPAIHVEEPAGAPEDDPDSLPLVVLLDSEENSLVFVDTPKP
jgi:hypothetical protein